MEWKTTWSYLNIEYGTNIGTLQDITQRTFIKNNLNGLMVRIQFSNLYSEEDMLFDHVTVGVRAEESELIKRITTVTYQGNKMIRVSKGDKFYSDEIKLTIAAGEELVLSVYIKETTAICSVCSTWSAKSWSTVYGHGGDYTERQSFEVTDSGEIYPVLNFDPNKANHIAGISAVQVFADTKSKTLILFGDSITHMSYFSDALIARIHETLPGEMAIINRGLGGNRLLRDYSRVKEVPGGGTLFGVAGVDRFYRDVYKDDNPEYIFVLIGINDITHPYALNHLEEEITYDEYRHGIEKLINIAHDNNSKIMIGTITPFKNGSVEWFEKAESLRKTINEWIREQTLSDGIVDYDLATRSAEDAERMCDDCHMGDGLHPNYEGGKRMAEAVLIEWF